MLRPPDSTSAQPMRRPADAPVRAWYRRPRTWVLFAAAVVVLSSVGLGLHLLRGTDSQKFVAVYLTDLPGGCHDLILEIAGASVGDDDAPLKVALDHVRISDSQGPDEAQLVASGYVPYGTEGTVRLVMPSAECVLADGRREQVKVERPVVSIRGALPKEEFRSNAALFDLNLDVSLSQDEDGTRRFESHVQNVYHYGGLDVDVAKTLERLVANLEEIADFEVLTDELSDKVADRICDRLGSLCVSPSVPTHPLVSGAPTLPPIGTSQTPPPPGTNLPPAPPVQPSPGDAALGVAKTVNLDWAAAVDPDGDALTYKVLLGTSPTLLQEACPARAKAPCSPGDLLVSTTYFWRVVVSDGRHTVDGPVWSFATTAVDQPNRPPTLPVLQSPLAGAKGQANAEKTLRWTGSDPDGNPIEYKILHGTTNPPTEVRCDWQSDLSCLSGQLLYSRHYYWRVLVRDGEFTVEGPVWDYATATPPNPPANPSPANGAMGSTDGTSIALTWTGSDEEGDGIDYKVYLWREGTTPVPLSATWSTQTTIETGPLVMQSDYYWRVDAKDWAGTTEGTTWKFGVGRPAVYVP